ALSLSLRPALNPLRRCEMVGATLVVKWMQLRPRTCIVVPGGTTAGTGKNGGSSSVAREAARTTGDGSSVLGVGDLARVWGPPCDAEAVDRRVAADRPERLDGH